MLLFVTCFVFIWGRAIIGTIDSTFDLSIFELQNAVDVSNIGQKIYLEAVFASMVTFLFALLYLSKSRNFDANQKSIAQYNRNSSNLISWKLLFSIGVLFSLLQAAFFLNYFLSGGSYYEIFILGKDAIGFPGLSVLASLLFVGYVGILVFSDSQDNKINIYVLIFILVSLLQLVKGSRGEIFSQILVGVWLYYFYLKRSPRLLHLTIAFLSLVILAEFVSFFRSDDLAQLANSKDILLKLKWFIYSQGASGELVGVITDYFEVGLSSFRFILSPLLNPFRRIFDPEFGEQTVEYGESSGLLSHEISWRLSPSLYLSGHGVGSSYIAESYLTMGLIGVIAATSLIIYLVSNPRGIWRRSRSRFFVFSCTLPYILFTPRESLVFFVVPAIKSFAMLFIVNLFYAKFSYRRYSNL